MDNIGLIVDIKTLYGFAVGGGEKIENSLVKTFYDYYENFYIIPKIVNIHEIKNNTLNISNLTNNKIKNKILGIEYVNDNLELEKYIDKISEDILSSEIKLLIDLNYSPSDIFQNILTRNKKLKKEKFLRFGEIVYYSHKLRLKGAVLLQGEGLNRIIFGIPTLVLKHWLYKKIGKIPFDLFRGTHLRYLKKKGILEWSLIKAISLMPNIIRIYGLSRGQLENLGIHFLPKAKVIDPPFALPKSLYQYRVKKEIKKQNYAIFSARLIPLKGIYELPYIIDEIKRNLGQEDIKLYVMGYSSDTKTVEHFNNICERLKVKDNIEYIGFLKGEELFEKIANAKVFIYPTHEDSFSLSVLEAISLRTPVVTYDLNAFKTIYKDIPIVKMVKEFDYKQIAIEAEKILKMNENEYYSFVSNPYIDKFVEKFFNYEEIARKYYEDFERLMNS